MLDVVLEIESNHFNEQFENTLVKMISSMKITPEQFIKTLDMIDPGMAGELDGFLEGVK